MDSSRAVRQVRKSPVRYHAEAFVKKERSRSRPRKAKTPDKGSKKPGVSDADKVHKSRRRSPSRNARSPSKSPSRRKVVEEKIVQKRSLPFDSAETKSSKDISRFSLTPDRAKIEEVIRSSVSRFEEVLAEVTPVIKRRIKGENNKVHKEEIKSDGLEQITNITESIEIIEKGTTAGATTLNTNSKNCSINKNYREFGGLFGVLILICLLPLLVIISQLCCTQENCKQVPSKITLSLKRFFDLDATLWYIAFLVIQFLLSSLPLGPKLGGGGNKGMDFYYRRNGLGCLLLTASFLGGVRYFFNFSLIKVLDKTLPLLVTAIFCALVFIFFLYCLPLKEKNRNPFANTQNLIYDMWMGRDINPRWGPFDVKISLIRSSLIFFIAYNGLLVMKEIETKSNPSEYSVMLITICTLQALFAIDPLVCESSLISSFIVGQEGAGYYLIMSLAVMPFWMTLIPKYLYSSRPEYNIWVVLMTVSIHLVGHIIYRISCSQNDKFYKNSHSLKTSGVLFSRYSEKVFRGGLRSKVRYPEYSGILLIVFSWCLGCLLVSPLHWVPLSVLIVTVAAVIIQTRRLDSRSNMKHNLSWMNYVSDTSSSLIPYIY